MWWITAIVWTDVLDLGSRRKLVLWKPWFRIITETTELYGWLELDQQHSESKLNIERRSEEDGETVTK